MSGSKQKWIALLLALGLAALGGLSLWNERRNAPQPDEAMEGWQEYTVYWFDVFDTVTRVVGYAPSQEEWTRQMDALHEDLVAYHQLFDIYNSYEGVTSLKDVNRLLKEFGMMQQMTKQMTKMAGKRRKGKFGKFPGGMPGGMGRPF